MLQSLQSLHKTFYDSRFYCELARSWKGIGFGFLLVISAVNLLQLSYYLHEPYTAIKANGPSIIASLPSLEIANGKISSDADHPVKIKLVNEVEKQGPFFILFDTTQELTDRDATMKKMKAEGLLLLIHSNALVMYSPAENALEIYKSSDMKNAKIGHDDWKKLGDVLASMFLPGVLFFSFLMFLFGHLLTAFLGAIVIFIVSPLFKTGFDLASAMRVASAAKVPVVVVFLVATPHQTAQILLWFGFAMFGLFSVKQGCKKDTVALPPNGLA